MLLDVRMPGMSDLDVLRVVRESYSLVEVIMVSAISEVEVAVQAMKDGAYHYITKEFDYDGLPLTGSQRTATSRPEPAGDVAQPQGCDAPDDGAHPG